MAVTFCLGAFTNEKWEIFMDEVDKETPRNLEGWLLKHYQAREITPANAASGDYRLFLFEDDSLYMEFCLRWL